MKFFVAFVSVAVLAGLSTAEPPSRFRTRFFARQEAAPEAEPTTPAAEAEAAPAPSGPYPPSGWKPAGRALELPTEKAAPPATSYGTPQTVYGAPTTPPPATDPEASTEPESEAVQPDGDDAAAPDASGRLRQRAQKLTAATVQQGDFFVLVPDAGFQRLQLVPAQRQNAKFSARLTQASQPVFILNP